MTFLPEPALALLDRQWGAIGRFQLRDWLTEGAVDGLHHRRRLVAIVRGVYRVAGGARPAEQRLMAAVLRARPAARVTGAAVLGMLGVDGLDASAPFEVLTMPGRHLREPAFPHRPNPTHAAASASIGALPVVTPSAALVDAARSVDELGDRALRVAFDSARCRGLVTIDRLRRRLCALPEDDVGARWWRARLDDFDLRPESEPERRVGHLLRSFDPEPEPQVWVLPHRRVDWYFRTVRVAVEYQGAVDHAHGAARLDDAARAAELEEHGIHVVPVVAADLRAPDGLLAWLDALCARRAALMGVEPPRRRARAPD